MSILTLVFAGFHGGAAILVTTAAVDACVHREWRWMLPLSFFAGTNTAMFLDLVVRP